MVQRERLAVMKDVLIRHLGREEYAKGIGRRGSRVEKLEIWSKRLIIYLHVQLLYHLFKLGV